MQFNVCLGCQIGYLGGMLWDVCPVQAEPHLNKSKPAETSYNTALGFKCPFLIDSGVLIVFIQWFDVYSGVFMVFLIKACVCVISRVLAEAS